MPTTEDLEILELIGEYHFEELVQPDAQNYPSEWALIFLHGAWDTTAKYKLYKVTDVDTAMQTANTGRWNMDFFPNPNLQLFVDHATTYYLLSNTTGMDNNLGIVQQMDEGNFQEYAASIFDIPASGNLNTPASTPQSQTPQAVASTPDPRALWSLVPGSSPPPSLVQFPHITEQAKCVPHEVCLNLYHGLKELEKLVDTNPGTYTWARKKMLLKEAARKDPVSFILSVTKSTDMTSTLFRKKQLAKQKGLTGMNRAQESIFNALARNYLIQERYKRGISSLFTRAQIVAGNMNVGTGSSKIALEPDLILNSVSQDRINIILNKDMAIADLQSQLERYQEGREHVPRMIECVQRAEDEANNAALWLAATSDVFKAEKDPQLRFLIVDESIRQINSMRTEWKITVRDQLRPLAAQYQVPWISDEDVDKHFASHPPKVNSKK